MTAPIEGAQTETQKEGPLAEYTALRAESLQCSQYMSVLFSLLIATNGVVLGVAMRSPIGAGAAPVNPAASASAHPSPFLVLLVLPVVSYLITVRYTYLYLGTLRIGAYIDRELAPRIPGGIGWERWLRDTKLKASRISQTLSDLIAFVGTSLLGLIGSALALGRPADLSPWWGLWLLCLVLTVLTAHAVRVRHKARRTFSMLARQRRDADASWDGDG